MLSLNRGWKLKCLVITFLLLVIPISACTNDVPIVEETKKVVAVEETPLPVVQGTPIIDVFSVGETEIDDSRGQAANLVWADEFNYTGLPDPTKWSFEVANPGWVNNELQHYTDSVDNANVDNGELTLTLQKETADNGDDIYTSARIVSRDKGDWLFGRFEIRAKLPTGKGTWPAIWMMPTDSAYGEWPSSGEIDILEYVGYQPGVIHASVHTLNYNFNRGNNFTQQTTIENEDQYHIYAFEWTPDRMEFFIDGTSYAVFENGVELSGGSFARLHTGWEAYPFDKKFYMILNIAYGGNWGGSGGGVDDEILPRTLVVDYVRAYGYEFAFDDKEAPSIPSEITTFRDLATVLPLKWKASNDDTSVEIYEIYDSEGELLGTSSSNSFNLEGLEPETSYSIKIRALDIAGNISEFSPVVDMKTSTYSPYIVSSSVLQTHVFAANYETMVGIDTEETTDVLAGRNVGWIDNGDHMNYLIQVKESGDYTFTGRVASEIAGAGVINLSIDGNQLATMNTVNSQGWQDWENITQTITLEAGDYILEISGERYNINWFSIGADEYIVTG